MTQVPVLSLKPVVDGEPDGDAKVAREMLPIMQSWGAFQLRDHGVPQSVIDAAFAAAKQFHDTPLETRMQLKIDKNNRGYAPVHQSHYPGNKPDLKESFNVGMGLTEADPDVAAGKPLHGVNRWPELKGFRTGRGLFRCRDRAR